MKKGWQIKPFEDCIESVKYTRKIQRKDFLDDGQFPIVSQEAEFTNGYWNDEADVFKISNPVVIFGDHTQILKYVNFDFVLGADGVKILSPREFLHPKFFFYQLQAANLISLGYARHYRLLKELEIKYPPLTEQQRIVEVLDEAFASLATAKANAEKNIQNARALFESHLQAIFTQCGKGWVDRTVKQIAAPFKGSIRTGPFGSQLLHSEFVDEGIAVLGIDNAVANEFRWGKSRFITPEKYRQLERYTVHPGDVLITIMGTCGRCAIVPDDIPTAINTKHICCITLDNKQCLPDYLHIYFLHAPQSQEFLTKHAKGAIMAGLNMGIIQELPVMLPPIKVQEAITEATTTLSAETQRLAGIYKQKLAALDALKQSLLHQAFSGQL